MGAVDLKGRKALVTGGARGLGAGMAKALSEAGAHVMLADVLVDAGRETARQLSASSDNADEGVLIEQPGLGGGASELDEASSNNGGGRAGARVSPTSSGVSDEAVLLERD